MDGVDLQREIAFQALLVADWAQTQQIVNEPQRYREKNLILGDQPSEARVNTYFLLAGAGHWLISETLPPDWRKTWQMMSIVVQAGVVYQNYQIGLELKF